MTEIHAIILTLNEEQHLRRCIESLEGQCTSITVIDSGSTDNTVAIARAHGAAVLFNPWVNYATQLNFGINALSSSGGWVLRIDADEIVDPNSIETLIEAVNAGSEHYDGLLVNRRLHFQGRRMRYGAVEPSWQLRLWRNGSGRCEARWMDEHILVNGAVGKSQVVLSDINLNSLTWWTAKHNNYASREAIDILNHRHGIFSTEKLDKGGTSDQARTRRFLKENIYVKLPSGVRALAYFLYRYILRGGFRDGSPGYYFHILQGLWYRTLVDAKVREIESYAIEKRVPLTQAVRECTGLDPLAAFEPELSYTTISEEPSTGTSQLSSIAN